MTGACYHSLGCRRDTYGLKSSGLCRVRHTRTESGRVPWFKSTAQTYAGIMLWFVFWESVPESGAGVGGILAIGADCRPAGRDCGALICHFASYLAPA